MRSMRSSRRRHSDALGEGLAPGCHLLAFGRYLRFSSLNSLIQELLELLELLELYRFASQSRIASSPAGT